MFLFLDVISPIPEFCVIDDNKIILKQKITKSETDKLSDNIIQSYLEIDKRLNLTKNLKKISTTIGPGSYTSLRVGSAFISGLMISRNISYYPITIEDILNFNAIKHSKKNLGVFITSSNNQKFFCYKIKDNNMKYYKIENNKYSIPKNIDFILYNESKINENNELEQMKFSFFEEFYTNYNNFNFKKNIIIEPIYISNNQLLN
jgi:tRNA A37 threonylcarbamoyladenosine modification protein TsaB